MNSELRKMLSSNVRAERVRSGLTQLETANILGISQRQYLLYENGRKIDSVTLYRLSKIFNCNIEAFFLNFNSTMWR